jgi:hypothetical protein
VTCFFEVEFSVDIKKIATLFIDFFKCLKGFFFGWLLSFHQDSRKQKMSKDLQKHGCVLARNYNNWFVKKNIA